MARVIGWAIFLKPTAPTEFVSMFQKYLRTTERLNLHYFLAGSIDQSAPLFSANIVHAGESDWEIYFPYDYIFTISEVADPKKPIGFI